MRKLFLLLAGWLLANGSAAQMASPLPVIPEMKNRYAPQQKVYHYKLGGSRLPLHVTSYGRNKRIVMVSVHSDELTAVEAASAILPSTGGTLVRLDNDGQRLITFSLQGKSWKFDPNRIFTRAGIEADLQKHNKRQSPRVVRAIEGFARFILRRIPDAPTLIALHNNDEQKFSILSYLNSDRYKSDVRAVYTNEQHDPDNFFLTTDAWLYDALRESGYNVILQHNKNASDDGSLSIYFGRRNKSYVNVEAQHGSLPEQREMIGRLLPLISGN